MSEPGIVDGHAPDPAHPPGPELRRLSDAIRLVIECMVHTAASPATLTTAAETIERVGGKLRADTPPWKPSLPAMVSRNAGPHEIFPFDPVVGPYNPIAPPVDVEVRDGVAYANAVLGAPYEGPPGCVHGGIVAAIFDMVLGIANIAAGVGAMTGTLEIVYRSPTPLNTELQIEARHERIEGRKVYTVGTIHAGERLCAEARGTFIQVAQDRFLQHAREHGDPSRR